MQYVTPREEISVEDALANIERSGTNVCLEVGGVVVFSGKWPDDKDTVFLSNMLLKTYVKRLIIVDDNKISIIV